MYIHAQECSMYENTMSNTCPWNNRRKKHVSNKVEMKCEGETHVNEMIKVKEMKKMHQAHVSVKRCVQHM